MKIKLSEATPIQINWLVAKCEGIELNSQGLYNRLLVDGHMSRGQEMLAPYRPTTDWAQGGPIIEREEIDLNCYESPKTGVGWWSAEITGTQAKAKAHTPLIAAMRCYVASKLGDEVKIPEELK